MFAQWVTGLGARLCRVMTLNKLIDKLLNYTVLMCNQSLGTSQPPPLIGMGNEYRARGGGSVLRLHCTGHTS